MNTFESEFEEFMGTPGFKGEVDFAEEVDLYIPVAFKKMFANGGISALKLLAETWHEQQEAAIAQGKTYTNKNMIEATLELLRQSKRFVTNIKFLPTESLLKSEEEFSNGNND